MSKAPRFLTDFNGVFLIYELKDFTLNRGELIFKNKLYRSTKSWLVRKQKAKKIDKIWIMRFEMFTGASNEIYWIIASPQQFIYLVPSYSHTLSC